MTAVHPGCDQRRDSGRDRDHRRRYGSEAVNNSPEHVVLNPQQMMMQQAVLGRPVNLSNEHIPTGFVANDVNANEPSKIPDAVIDRLGLFWRDTECEADRLIGNEDPLVNDGTLRGRGTAR